jgi:hypothetical protein
MARSTPQNPEDLAYPALFVAVDAKSDSSQRAFFAARAAELVCLALGAGFGLLTNDAIAGLGPILAVALFLIALALQLSRVGAIAERRWYDARAAAESIKSASWQYAVGGEAFRLDGTDADIAFVRRLEAVLDSLEHLDIPASTGSSRGATADMRQLRAAPMEERARRYRLGRIEDQVGWYGRQARFNRIRARWWRAAVVSAEAFAIVAGLLRVRDTIELDLLGVFAAIAAGIVAWTQAKGHTQLAEAYSVTSHEVGLVAESIRADVDESVWAQSVHDAEAAFSREHTMWVVRRQAPQR